MTDNNTSPAADGTEQQTFNGKAVGFPAEQDFPEVKLSQQGLQYQVNILVALRDCLERIKGSVNLTENSIDFDALIGQLTEGHRLIRDHLKRLQIAEKGGWDAVRKYDGASEIGDDPDDCKTIAVCINKAAREKKAGRGGGARFNPIGVGYGGGFRGGYGGGGYGGGHGGLIRWRQRSRLRLRTPVWPPRSGCCASLPSVQAGTPMPGALAPKVMKGRARVKWNQCIQCDKFGHWRSTCTDISKGADQ